MTENGKGKLFDIQPKSAGKNADLIPLKICGAISDTAKYGGYDSATTAYFMLVRSKGKKGKVALSLEAYPLWLDKRSSAKEDKLKFCTERIGLKDPEILFDNIKLNTLFCIDGSYAWLRGITGKQLIWRNANELFLDEESMRTLKNISNYMRDRKRLNKPDLRAGDKITAEGNIRLYDALVEKLGSSVYAGLSVKGQEPFLRGKREAFAELSREDQCKIIFEVLHLMQCNSVLSDFSSLGGVAHAGKNFSNKFVQDMDIKMIFQSPTGYYRRVVDLKEFV